MTHHWTTHFAGLRPLEAPALEALDNGSQVVSVPDGTVVFRPGDACSNYMLVIKGGVRVRMISESGREIVLYRVEPGGACILTTACLMNAEDYNAEGIAEGPVEAAVIPATLFHELLGSSAAFRRFVFSAFGTRISDLMLLVEEVAFRRIDVRLARFLLERAVDGRLLGLTHQALAAELGTAREVVSRQLKDFEHRGWIALGRERIELLETRGMSGLADEGAL